jgi:6-phosphogluconolactonase
MNSKKPVSYYAYVGSRTTRERNARGDGINVYRVDGETGLWVHVQLVPGLLNPSFLAFDRGQRFLYAVHGDASEISAFSISPGTGKLTFVSSTTTSGKNPVHLTVDPSNRFVLVANHITSTVAVLPRRQDGSLGEPTHLVPMEGQIGPHRVEQPFAKPHQVEFDHSGRYVLVPDKGLDCTFAFVFDSETGNLTHTNGGPAPSREGSGPRHVAFNQSSTLAYVLNELDSSITAYGFHGDSGTMVPVQVISTLPDTFVGFSRAAEIAVSQDGRFVYASNRGHDSIAVLGIDQATGRLVTIDWSSSGGRTPRFFTLSPSGKQLLIANEDTDTIASLEVDQVTGRLSNSCVVAQTGSPVCIICTNIEGE